MSVKKQIPSLCKLYSFHEEMPEEFLEETDVDSSFYQNISDNSQSQHRKARVSKGFNKKFCNRFVPILRFEDSSVISSKKS